MNPASLISSVENVLLQGRALLSSVSDETYTRSEGGQSGASVGAHYRHILDHFTCLLKGLRSGQINYDQRDRDAGLERSRHTAILATESLLEQFSQLSPAALRQECAVLYSVGYGDTQSEAVPSNIARELMFCVGHAIHHNAILKLICAAMSVELPYEFGVAPSTLKHREATVR
jgi:hypothetical protein